MLKGDPAGSRRLAWAAAAGPPGAYAIGQALVFVHREPAIKQYSSAHSAGRGTGVPTGLACGETCSGPALGTGWTQLPAERQPDTPPNLGVAIVTATGMGTCTPPLRKGTVTA